MAENTVSYSGQTARSTAHRFLERIEARYICEVPERFMVEIIPSLSPLGGLVTFTLTAHIPCRFWFFRRTQKKKLVSVTVLDPDCTEIPYHVFDPALMEMVQQEAKAFSNTQHRFFQKS